MISLASTLRRAIWHHLKKPSELQVGTDGTALRQRSKLDWNNALTPKSMSKLNIQTIQMNGQQQLQVLVFHYESLQRLHPLKTSTVSDPSKLQVSLSACGFRSPTWWSFGLRSSQWLLVMMDYNMLKFGLKIYRKTFWLGMLTVEKWLNPCKLWAHNLRSPT